MTNKFLFSIIFFILLFFNRLVAEDNIPIIVISPSKTPQSVSTTGTSVTVLNQQDLNNSNKSFLGDSLNKSVTGLNFWQAGGAGTQAGIQLRGLSKAYTTVYVDGVKKSEVDDIEGVNIIDMCGDTGFLASKSEARRALKENSIAVNSEKVTEDFIFSDADLINGKYILLQRGKKNKFLVVKK